MLLYSIAIMKFYILRNQQIHGTSCQEYCHNGIDNAGMTLKEAMKCTSGKDIDEVCSRASKLKEYSHCQ